MEILFLIIGLLIGAIVSWYFLSKKHNELQSDLEERLSFEKEQRVKTQSELQSLKNVHDEVYKNMKNNLDLLAAKSMQENNKNFMQLAQVTMDKYFEKADNKTSKKENELINVLKPIKEKLDRQENLVKSFQSNSDKTFGSIKNYIEELNKSQNTLAKETQLLASALKSPRVRGRWGEIGLKRIIDFSGMSEFCDYEEQANVNTEEGRLRPDLVVSLPDNKKIIVDSKVPLNAYLEAIETSDDKLQKEYLEKHAKAVQSHVKQLSSKAYWSQFEGSVDFVVLYMEVEPAFAAALQQNKNLITDAIQNRIVFATPTTLITLLQTVAYSWKQHKATENAIAIWHTTKESYNRIAIFTEHLQKIGINIDNLSKTFNQAVGSWEHRVEPGLRKIEELGIDSENKNLKKINRTENTVRSLKKTN